MNEALGLVETRGITNAIFVADVMVKTANVRIIEIENTKGSGYITIKIAGDVGAVNAAVLSGKNIAIQYDSLISAKVIPRPSVEVQNIFCNMEEEKELILVQKNKKDDEIDKEQKKVIKDMDELKIITEESEIKAEVIEEDKENKTKIEAEKSKLKLKKSRKATIKKSRTKKNESDKE